MRERTGVFMMLETWLALKEKKLSSLYESLN
jgi:hypothetical protein